MAAHTKSETYHHGDLRRALVDAARQILDTEGLDALSLRAVARRAGVSHAAPYHHFADKDQLLAAVAEQGFRELYAAMSAHTAGIASAGARLSALGETYVRFALENTALFRLMLGPRFATAQDHPGVAEAGEAGYNLLLDTARDWITGAGANASDARRVAAASWCMVHGLAELMVDGKINADLDPAADSDLLRVRDILEAFDLGRRP